MLAARGIVVEDACLLKALALDERFRSTRRRKRGLGGLLNYATRQFARGELKKTWAVASTRKNSRAYSMLKKIGEKIGSGLIDGRKQSVFLIDLRKAVKN